MLGSLSGVRPEQVCDLTPQHLGQQAESLERGGLLAILPPQHGQTAEAKLGCQGFLTEPGGFAPGGQARDLAVSNSDTHTTILASLSDTVNPPMECYGGIG